jgi:hypothetical protein
VLLDGLLVERVDPSRLGDSPTAEISSATASTLASVRPARKTFAPSRAKAWAIAPPIDPPAP